MRRTAAIRDSFILTFINNELQLIILPFDEFQLWMDAFSILQKSYPKNSEKSSAASKGQSYKLQFFN
jgi:hypothetical protein